MTQYPEAWLCRELGIAVVNISLITDYDAGVHEGTEAVNATDVLEVFQANAERIQKVVLDLIGRFPADLDALGARDALGPTRGDGHTIAAEDIRLFETGLCEPDGDAGAAADRGLPAGDPRRARLVAGERPAPRRGRATPALWCWDHFMGRGDQTVPVVEALDDAVPWPPAQTDAGDRRAVRAQRHEPPSGPRRPDGLHAPDRQRRPAHPGHRDRRRAAGARGLRHGLPGGARSGSPGSRRPSRSSGRCGPAGRSPGRRRSTRWPRRTPTRCPDPAPRIVIGGETPAGARLAGRIGDGWNTFDDNFEANLPLYLEALEAAGRRREDQLVLVGFQGDWLGERVDPRHRRGSHDPRATWERWREAGADGAIVLARTTDDVDALVDAVDRW